MVLWRFGNSIFQIKWLNVVCLRHQLTIEKIQQDRQHDTYQDHGGNGYEKLASVRAYIDVARQLAKPLEQPWRDMEQKAQNHQRNACYNQPARHMYSSSE
jgi:hypothetical protein